MIHYDKERVKAFYESILAEYDRDNIIDTILRINESDAPEEMFTYQVGITPLIDEDLFTNRGWALYTKDFLLAGRFIANGERDLLVNTLLSNKQLPRESIKLSELTPKRLRSSLGTNKYTILFPVGKELNVFSKDWMRYVSYTDGKKKPRMQFLSYYDMVPVPDTIIGNRIVLLDTRKVYWEQKLFTKGLTRETSRLDIQLREHENGKVRVWIRSVHKMLLFPDAAKIIDLI